MNARQPAIEHMQSLLEGWESAGDRRCVFLDCYNQMTGNMLLAIQAGEFHDNDWVLKLLEHFADYYFNALQDYEQLPQYAPIVWQVAFEVAQDSQAHVLKHLMLGINAHINYDLVFALEDVLRDEWASLPPNLRAQRYEDHCRVNDVIARTLDSVQDSVVERFAPKMDLIDTLMGQIDERLATILIAAFRDRVWQMAVKRLEAEGAGEQERIRSEVERSSLQLAQAIRNWGLTEGVRHFFDGYLEER